MLGIVAFAAAIYIGLEIDAHRWREPIAAELSRALGREVRLEGHARLTLSRHPAVALGEVRIANPQGFDAHEFARIAELRVSIRLLPLVWGEIHPREAYGRRIAVALTRSSDGRFSWNFDPIAQGPFRLALGDAYRFVVEQMRIQYSIGDTRRQVEVTELVLEGRPEERAQLSLRGTVDDRFPYTIRASGAPLSGLGAAEPWPFDFHMGALDAVVRGSGTMSGPFEHPTVQLSFSAGAAHQAGASMVSGRLALLTSGERPSVSGQVSIHELDLRSLSAHARDAGTTPVTTLAEAFNAYGDTELDLTPLALVDADIALDVERWIGLPGEVRDLSARLRIDAGRLAGPIAARIAGALFEGEVVADGTSATPRVRVQLVTQEAPLRGLAELVFDVPYVVGSVGRFDLELDASGSTVSQLVRDLQARVEIDRATFTYGNFAGGKPVAMRIDAAEVSQPRGRAITGSLRGALRSKPFDGKLQAGTVERILRDQRTPFSFQGESGSARARLSGTLAEPAETTGPIVTFDVSARHARELAPWLGFSSKSDASVAIKGTVQVQRRAAALTDGSLLVGRTFLTGDASWRSADAGMLVKANVAAQVLAPVELRTVMTPSVATARRATILEIPILPESLDFADMDVSVRVSRVDGLPLEITDAAFEGRMRGGVVEFSPFSFYVVGNGLAGGLTLDARGDAPSAAIRVAGQDFDLGALLRRMRFTRDVDARIGALSLYANLHERMLGDVLERSSFVASIESGTLDIRDANTGAALRIAVDTGEVRADAGAPISASVSGKLGAIPVTLEARTAPLPELFVPSARLPFSVAAETPAAKLTLSGSAAPQRDPDVELSLALTGERLNGLDDLLETSLPPWGPYSLTGRLRFDQRGYEIGAMRLALGSSALEGTGSLHNDRVPPNLSVALNAERIQLDDFPIGDWSLFDKPVRAAEPLTPESAREAVAEGVRRVHSLFSRELLGRADGKLEVVVQQVVSGRDDLGRARLVAAVADGRATIAPIEIESPVGSVRGSFVYEPREYDVVVDARAEIDRFDYGALMRRVHSGSDIDGVLSLDFRLAATAPRLSDALATGSGRFDVAVWPQELQAGPFDLWATSVVFRLLPFVGARASTVNCIVGHFDLEGGQLRSRRLLLDTYHTRTEGEGTIDVRTDAVGFRFVPRAKVPQVFAFLAPVHLNGTRDGYRFSVRPIDLLGGAARWIASPVTVPIQRLFGTRLPGDGSDVCANPGR